MSDYPTSQPNSARGRVRAHEAPDRRLVDREAEPTQDVWTLEPHICRSCFGRLVSRPGATDGWRIYLCTNCGVEASALAAAQVCCCGTKLRKPTASGRSGSALIDAGIRCQPNPAPTPDFPSVIVAFEVAK